jgi:hypothetical protein
MHLQESLRENSVGRGYEAQTATQFLQSKTQDLPSDRERDSSWFSRHLRDWPCDHNRAEGWQRLRIDAHFFIRALADSLCKDEHFSNRRGRLDEKQTEEQKGSFDSQWESSWE